MHLGKTYSHYYFSTVLVPWRTIVASSLENYYYISHSSSRLASTRLPGTAGSNQQVGTCCCHRDIYW